CSAQRHHVIVAVTTSRRGRRRPPDAFDILNLGSRSGQIFETQRSDTSATRPKRARTHYVRHLRVERGPADRQQSSARRGGIGWNEVSLCGEVVKDRPVIEQVFVVVDGQ